MAKVITLPTHADARGALTVLEKILPFEIKRLYWIYDLNDQPRGRHRHHQTRQALVCLKGRCEVLICKHNQEEVTVLNQPNQLILLEPDDWHELRGFTSDTLMLLISSHAYDPADYIMEPLV